MEDILPVEAYLRQARLPRIWLFLAIGGLLGLLCRALIAGAAALDPNRPLPDDPASELLWGVAGGAAIALVFHFGIGVRMRQLIRASYEGAHVFETAVPQEGELTHRLPAVLVPQAGWKVAGALFAGPGRLAFVPQRVTLGGRREPRWFPVFSDFEVVPGALPAAPWKRFLGAAGQSTLEIRGGGESWLLWVPDAETGARALRAVVAPAARAARR